MSRCVVGPTLLVSALLLTSACDTQRDPTTSQPSFPPTDGGVGGQGATVGGGTVLPDEELASHTLPALSVTEHHCVSGFDESR